MMSNYSNAAWSVAEFETRRQYLCDWLRQGPVDALERNVRFILICAPVKSGKRVMVEYIAQRDNTSTQHRVHVFISAFHRRADETQREELSRYKIHVVSGIDNKAIENIKKYIRESIGSGKRVVLHLDECDYGSGERQKLSKILREWRDNPNVQFILYSATAEEVIFSSEINREDDDILENVNTNGVKFKYVPPEDFCGPKRFLDENLVEEAQPFFIENHNGVLSLSQQGRQILSDCRLSMATNPNRNIIILRLSYSAKGGNVSERMVNKAIHKFLNNISTIIELRDVCMIADKEAKTRYQGVLSQNVKWSDRVYWDLITSNKIVLVICDQTSSRSTEWAHHDRVFAYHDYRNQVIFSVVSQAQERVNHYGSKYGGFQPIRVYGSKKSFQLSADMISYEEYIHKDWEKRKVDRRRSGNENLYEIRRVDDRSLHPEHNQMISEDRADEILNELGCMVDTSLSARVKGDIAPRNLINAKFVECNKETFEQVDLGLIHNSRHQNPFIEAENNAIDGRLASYIRGVWKVRTFEEIKNENWGIDEHTKVRIHVCYKDDVLGVAVRQFDGSEIRDSLTSYKSMYRPRIQQ